MVDILRLRNPVAFFEDGLGSMIVGAFADDKFSDGEAIRAELARLAADDYVCILAGRENDRWRGLSVIMEPKSKLFQNPQVYWFYNKGTARLRRELVRSTVAWIRERGYDTFTTANRDGRDMVFARLFAAAGEPEIIGTIFAFELREPE